MDRLKGEEANLNVGDHTIETLVDTAVTDFENKRKRTLDIIPKSMKPEVVNITGLKHNADKRFIRGGVVFDK